ncbi:hypothetical protein RRG08_032261 [Elysia crispata]|uniref:PiggyBac transposable element-derived protein domain-containing protein n=1 Tax=Elysia crispata TaxID=231223 RepID=A0AAE1AS96_9GAST|nr:hypothetical protein RRG08_032261 [Elysia crispata]
MARFDATTAREMLMEFFDNDDSDEEEVLLDLEEVLTDQNGEIIRTEDIIQAPSNRIIEEDEDEGWLCASNPPLVEPFTGTSEVKIDLSDDPKPSEFFKFFFPDEIIQDWVDQTNMYVLSKLDVTHELPEHSRLRSWRELTLDEMKVFLGLLINTGLVRKDNLREFWTTDVETITPFFSKNMSLKRFESIMWNFHINDNENDDGSDPLFKVRPFYSHLRQKYLDAYSPSQNLSFDEATCPYKGRLRFKVYNPMKPAKFGIKIYEVNESDTGYLLRMNVYIGSTEETPYHELVDLPDECSTTTKIVVGSLAYCGLLHKGHHVYLDNYYNSPELFNELTLLGTGACGTKSVQKPVSHHQFRLEIVRRLMNEAQNNPGPSSSGRKISNPPERLNLNLGHFPVYMEAKEGAKRKHPSRDCVITWQLSIVLIWSVLLIKMELDYRKRGRVMSAVLYTTCCG